MRDCRRLSLILVLSGCMSAPEQVVPIRKSWQGETSRQAEPFAVLVSHPAVWKTLLTSMFSGLENVPNFEPVDFEKEVVLALSDGVSPQCRGISPEEVLEGPDRIRVRVRHHTYQTGFSAGEDRGPRPPAERPWGFVVLPRWEGRKPVGVEYNVQSLLGHPPIWKEKYRLSGP